ncbi:MAG: CPBP family intramembrane metalloprotease [Actinomycetota bacterium]|nr:CPBP family intramembrane metalloprotease [Actinomycetota bacterium]
MLAAGALGAVQPWTGLNQQVLELVQFAPTIATGVVLALFRGPDRPTLRLGGGTGRQAAIGLVTLAGAAAGVFALCCLAYAATGRQLSVLPIGTLVAPFAVIVFAQWVGACGEEVGWRCLMQPLLERRYSTLRSSVIVGLLWGCWHIQVFARGGVYTTGFLIATVAMSIMVGVTIGQRGHNLVLASVFHLLINLGLLFLMNEENGDVMAMVVFGGACVAMCAVIVGHSLRATGRSQLAVLPADRIEVAR